MARTLYDAFIAPGCDTQVNVSSKMAGKLRAKIYDESAGDAALFDGVAAEIEEANTAPTQTSPTTAERPQPSPSSKRCEHHRARAPRPHRVADPFESVRGARAIRSADARRCPRATSPRVSE